MKQVSNPFRLDGETALITGGGSGIGFGIARTMIQSGAEIIITGRNENKLKETVNQLGDKSSYLVHDVTDYTRSEEVVRSIDNRTNGLSILVNNAGNHLKKPALETTDEEFHEVMRTHVHAAFALSRVSAVCMSERKRGSILFVASMASYLAIPKVTAYSAAKSAVPGMVRGFASELSPEGIRVNAVAPGFIESEMLRKATDSDPGRKQKIMDRTLLGRFGKTEEIGWACVYLCSPAGSFITGTVLPVDGGVHVSF